MAHGKVLRNLALPRGIKLKTDDISSVFNFGVHKQGQYLRLLVTANEFDQARFAVVVGKRIVKYSVDRNYCKRVVRELFRLSCRGLAGWNIVVQVRKQFRKAVFRVVQEEYMALIESMNLKR